MISLVNEYLVIYIDYSQQNNGFRDISGTFKLTSASHTVVADIFFVFLVVDVGLFPPRLLCVKPLNNHSITSLTLYGSHIVKANHFCL